MTEDEEKVILKQLHTELEQIILKYPDMFWFIETRLVDGTHTLYTGNHCAVCAAEAMMEWIKDNNIQHMGTDNIILEDNKKVH